MGLFSQDNRQARIDTPLGRDVLLLVSFSGEEAVSQLFRFQLDLKSEQRNIRPADVLRGPAAISVRLPDGSNRYINGFISRFSQGRTDALLTEYRAELVPWTWFLSLRRDCRIFQHKSVPDIVSDVFKDAGYTDYEMRCAARPEREFCVQYRETDLNFVQRLLEEEGIFYFFEHTEDGHKLILADNNSSIAACPFNPLPAMSSQASALDGVVTAFDRNHSVGIGRVTYRDYDFLQPTFTLEGAAPGQQGEEVYEYAPGLYTTREEGDRFARYRMEAEEALREQASGRSTCRQFISGHSFKPEAGSGADGDAEFLLTSVRHVCSNGDYRTDGSGESFDYTNEFDAVSMSVPFRPVQSTPKPTILGAQTALVVGPPGEEIFTDEHGRVRVHFPWDRLGSQNENSSAFVRVSHPWAGQGFGAVFIPRVGQEVIVDFLEGDPDHPIIIGRVYNALQKPPYDLPANQTQSGVKSRSTPNGTATNCNEIRFEDKKDSEEFFMQAERTMTIRVKGSESHSVSGSQSVSVGGSQSVSVGGNQTTKIKKDHNVEVTEGGYNIDVKQKQMFIDVPNAQFHVHGKKIWNIAEEEFTADVHGNTIRMDTSTVSITGKSKITLTCGGSMIELTPAGIKITSTGPVDVKGLPIKLNS